MKTSTRHETKGNQAEKIDRIAAFNFKIWLKQNWHMLVFLAALVCLAYFNSFNNAFISDDLYAIVENKQIDKIGPAIAQPIGLIRTLLYFVISNVFGKIPIFYRLLNIFFHLGTVWASFLLLSLLINTKTAFFASAILAVHPLQTEAVTWISGGPYSQYSFFVVLSLLAYILSKRYKGLFFVSVVSFLLAVISSEKAVIFPFILLLFVTAFSNMRRRPNDVAVFLAITAILVCIIAPRLGERVYDLAVDFGQQPRMVNPFLQIPVAITSYLKLIFWPKVLTLYHSETTFTWNEYLFRLFIFIVFLGIIAYSFIRHRGVFFWLSFFIISLLPTMSPFAISWVVAERYIYLGAIGIFVVMAMVLKKISDIPRLRLTSYIIFSLILLALAARTMVRNIDWKNNDNFWTAVGKTSPSSPNAHNNLGDIYLRRGELEKAEAEFKKTIELAPSYAAPHYNLGLVYHKMNKTKEALQYYQRAVILDPNIYQAYENSAAIHFYAKEYTLAKEDIVRALKIKPRDVNLHTRLGMIYLALNQLDQAKLELERALQLDPHNQAAKKILEMGAAEKTKKWPE